MKGASPVQARWRKNIRKLTKLTKQTKDSFKDESPSNVVFVCMVLLIHAIGQMDDVEADLTLQTVDVFLKSATETREETLQ